ncbi:MAG TPA: hypothetical protein VL098_00845 [Flavipsychrobacter sp.]|nr:hypothetical protein [Flavipsychrobacter sp.]
MNLTTDNFLQQINGIDHTLPVEECLQMAQQFAMLRPKLDGCAGGNNVFPISETFNLQAIRNILDQPNTVAFRAYIGVDKENRARLIFVGVNEQGQDIIGSLGTVTDNPSVAECGQRTP